ncbi:MAG TPA: class I SAM-dependent methyltransferase [Solirubrobacteraceae bacterium]|nr:class I SAM-dependent methyltransferase [Solirubrobacteraceae bacterium]
MPGRDVGLDPLLAEQLAYYRAAAPRYRELAIPDVDEGTLSAAAEELSGVIEAFGITGDVLELACGPGTWTETLARRATSVTAVDGAPEMLAAAQDRIDDDRIRFVQANIFEWAPDRRYDCVFFGFWLSHVPLEQFEPFWEMVAGALKPDGRVLFFDDGHRTADELIEGAESSTIRRTIGDGSAFRIVKVPHTPAELEAMLRRLGWDIAVYATPGPFFWGAGARARTARS